MLHIADKTNKVISYAHFGSVDPPSFSPKGFPTMIMIVVGHFDFHYQVYTEDKKKKK